MRDEDTMPYQSAETLATLEKAVTAGAVTAITALRTAYRLGCFDSAASSMQKMLKTFSKEAA